MTASDQAPGNPSPRDTTGRMPALYLGHWARHPCSTTAVGSGQLFDWSMAHCRSRRASLLIVSAHWENAPIAIPSSTAAATPLVYDFWGFPEQRFYELTYPTFGRGRRSGGRSRLVLPDTMDLHEHNPDRGLDHGAWVPLLVMYPNADVPVLQVSMPTLDPQGLYEIGRKLAPLRDEGVLIVGSGFFTHNLRALSLDGRVSAGHGRVRPLGAARRWPAATWTPCWTSSTRHPAAHQAHPRTEHFAPLFVTLGAAGGDLAAARSVIDGFWLGLAKRSIQVN